MTEPVSLSVIVVNWKVRDLLCACLHSLYEQTRMPSESWEVIVVDNDSRDGSVEMVRAAFPGVQVIANDQNIGFARANNEAFARCRGRHILLLNPDTLVLDHAVEAMVQMMETQPQVAVIGCRLLNGDGSFQRWTGGSPPGLLNIACHFLFLYKLFPWRLLPSPLYLESEPTADLKVGWVSAACMLVRRESLAGALFDEHFFLYGEDLELCDRLVRAGWQVVFTPKASIIHYEGRSLEQQTGEVKVNKLSALRDCFSRRHGPIGLLVYDVIVVVGFLMRWLLYSVVALVRPGQRHAERARTRLQFLAEAVRALVHR
jgi:N-acetylglucosaminyl-diphospho-decaprenol L-rhamnosyltransferase